jgi:uncharacterized membrane protein
MKVSGDSGRIKQKIWNFTQKYINFNVGYRNENTGK